MFEELPNDYRVFYFNFRGLNSQAVDDLIKVFFEVEYGRGREAVKDIVRELLKKEANLVEETKGIPIPEKLYIGKGMEVYKADKKQFYSMIYRDKKKDTVYAKRFCIKSYIMEKEYEVIPKGCRIDKIYTTYSVVVECEFEPAKRQQVTSCQIVFNDIAKRSLTARGFKVTDKKVKKYSLLERGTDLPVEATMVDGPTKSNNSVVEDSDESVVVTKPLLNKAIKVVFKDTKALYTGRTFEVLESTKSKKEIPLGSEEVTPVTVVKKINQKPAPIVVPEPIVQEPISVVVPEKIVEILEVVEKPTPVVEPEKVEDEPTPTSTLEKFEPIAETEEVIEIPAIEPEREAVPPVTPVGVVESTFEVPESSRQSSTLKKGGYRESSVEDRERRARRFFKIDDTPFTLEP